MNRLLIGAALVLASGAASAAVFTIDSGSWAQSTTWNNNADTSVNDSLIYNGGDDVPPILIAGAPNPAFGWSNDDLTPRDDLQAFTGSIGGSIETDGDGNVIGGTLVVTGTIGDQVNVGGNSWWLRIWEDVSIDLGTGTSTVGDVDCARSAFSPAPCFPAVLGGQPTAFDLLGGAITPGACLLPGGSNNADPDCGPDGDAQPLAVFDADAGLLQLFQEGRNLDNPNGTDLLYEFSVETTLIPVPAAAWLFGSALGLLGWVRRRASA